MEIPPIIQAYYGPITSRNVHEYASEWRNMGLGTMDELIFNQLQQANSQGRDRVCVLDIGCARDALMLKTLLEGETLSNSRNFMEMHPETHLELVGLTDAESANEFGKPLDLEESPNPYGKVTLNVVPYTLTTTQTLEKFLAQQRRADLQLVTAIWSLAYLGPHTFSKILATVREKLTPGGMFIGVGYAHAVAGLGFNINFNVYPDHDLVYLQRKNSLLNAARWKELLTQIGPSAVELSEEEIREAKLTMLQTIVGLLKKDYLAAEDAKKLESGIRASSTLEDLSSYGIDLRAPVFKMWQDKFAFLREKKDARIRAVNESEGFEVQSDEKTFVIRKVRS